MTLQGKTMLVLFTAALLGGIALLRAHPDAPASGGPEAPVPAVVVAPAHAPAAPRATAAELAAYGEEASRDPGGS